MGLGFITKDEIPKTVEESSKDDLEGKYPGLAFFDTEDEAMEHIKKIWLFQKPILDKIEDDNVVTQIEYPESFQVYYKLSKLYNSI